MIRIVFLLLSGVGYALSTCTAPGPIALPIKDIDNGINAGWMRGFPIGVGSPPQNLSFMPQAFLNDSWIYTSNNSRCQDLDTTQQACLTMRGGLFSPQDSLTFKPRSSVQAAGGDPSDVQQTVGQHYWESAWMIDGLSVGNISLLDFPIGTPKMSSGGLFDTQQNIGLGSNSIFLSTLRKTGQIASRTWSFYWGQDGVAAGDQSDGSIIFGGYDKAKTTGTGYTQDMILPEENCQSGMRVTISDLSLNFPNGTATSLTGHRQIFACLQPDFPALVTIPEDPYYNEFEALTGTRNVGKGFANGVTSGPLYLPGQAYDGDVTIELNSVFSVTIPNQVFVQPLTSIDNIGAMFLNQSVEQVRIDAVPGAEGATFILGRFFFSSVYLSIDLDARTYTLWPAKSTTETDLVAFGGNCSSPPVNTGSSNSTGSNRTKHGTSDTRGISTGAIVGIAVGCAVFAAVVGAIAILCFIRRRKRSKHALKNDKSSETDPDVEPMRDSYGGPRFYEAMSNHITELGAEQEPGEVHAVTAPQELSTDKADRERQRRMLQGMNSPVELS